MTNLSEKTLTKTGQIAKVLRVGEGDEDYAGSKANKKSVLADMARFRGTRDEKKGPSFEQVWDAQNLRIVPENPKKEKEMDVVANQAVSDKCASIAMHRWPKPP